MSTKTSVISPEPNSLICILAPTPPPVNVSKSPVSYKLPSLTIVLVPGTPVIFALMKKSSVSLEVPTICSPIENVQLIVSIFKINSEISVLPNINFLTDSTIAVAPEVCPVIVLPTN